MRRRLSAALSAIVVLALLPTAASAATFEAYIGGDKAPGLPKQSSPNAFYPRTVTIHPGDTVRWEWRGFHTLTFPARGKQPPPLVLVAADRPVSGNNDAAGAAFWFNGQPNILLNPAAVAPTKSKAYTGNNTVGTGIPQGSKPKPFAMRFRKAGIYTYYCAVHPGMKARVRVVSATRHVPSPAAQERTADRQLATDVAAAKQLDRRAAPAGDTVQVGRTGPTVALYKMYPTTRTVAANTPVTFTMAGEFRSEVHTVTFGPEKVRSGIEKNFIGPLAGVKPPVLGLLAVGVYPSDPPPLPPYDTTNHGDGFLNTGIIDNDRSTPFPVSATITFTKPGTYDYECVIHEKMDGKIVVR